MANVQNCPCGVEKRSPGEDKGVGRASQDERREPGRNPECWKSGVLEEQCQRCPHKNAPLNHGGMCRVVREGEEGKPCLAVGGEEVKHVDVHGVAMRP